MNYNEARAYLNDAATYSEAYNLDSMTELLRRLQDPQNDLKIVHIAGTNGKGSTLAFLSTILQQAGYEVGRYISPTIFSYRERIQILKTDGKEHYIEKNEFAGLMTQIKFHVNEMTKEGLDAPTVFEMETAAAFMHFKKQACDFVVLETGLGGLLDATNTADTKLMAVLTPIGMDHMAYLGTTLTEVARHKAGIIKKGCTVVTAPQKREVMTVIEDVCSKEGCRLVVAGSERAAGIKSGYDGQSFYYPVDGVSRLFEINLAGTFQIMNAVTAIDAACSLKGLGYPVTPDVIAEGLKKTVWRGRFTILKQEPLVVMDGAHNADAALELRKTLETYFPEKKIIYIMGVFADKEYDKIAEVTAPLADKIITVAAPENKRAFPAAELAEAVGKYHRDVNAADSIEKAVRTSLNAADKQDVIIAFGSLSYLGQFAEALDQYEKDKGEVTSVG